MRRRAIVSQCLAAVMALVFLSGCTADGFDRTALHSQALITLRDSGTVWAGDGVSVDGSTVSISAPGLYYLCGALSDGQIVVDAGEDAEVWLVLRSVSLVKNGDAAIHTASAKKLVLLSGKDSESLIQSRGAVGPGRENAALYADCELRLVGNGVLNFSSLMGHALVSEGACLLASGTVNLEAAQKGLYSRDTVTVTGGLLNADVGDDAVCTENGSSGTITVTGGELNLLAIGDGLEASGDITVSGGVLTINAGNGQEGNALRSGGSIRKTGGDMNLRAAAETISAAGEVDMKEKKDGA